MTDKNESFLKKLDEFEQRYIALEKQCADPDVASDTNKYIAVSKEQGKLRPIIEKYRDYKKTVTDIQDAQNIINDPEADPDFIALAEEELEQFTPSRDALLDEIKGVLVTADDKVINSIILEIRPGTGGDEAGIFVRDLYGMYAKYAEKRHWKIENISSSSTEAGGFREILVGIKGRNIYADFKYESGGHRVQRVPQTESQGRVHTSAATVAVMPEPKDVDINIKPSDVLEHVSRAGGPGGQAVNKLNSAIKLEHVPTGITVSMRDEKSQHKNRAKAWRILRSRIYEFFEQKERSARDKQRKTMIGSGDRSQKVRTYNYPQNRVTDHRINLSLYSLDKIIAGDLDEILAALKEYDKQLRLQEFSTQ